MYDTSTGRGPTSRSIETASGNLPPTSTNIIEVEQTGIGHRFLLVPLVVLYVHLHPARLLLYTVVRDDDVILPTTLHVQRVKTPSLQPIPKHPSIIRVSTSARASFLPLHLFAHVTRVGLFVVMGYIIFRVLGGRF